MKRHSATLSLTAILTLGCATHGLAQASEQEHLQHNVFAQMPWQELGPVIFGGRITDIAVHPENRFVYWLGAASGGLWKTTNNGISFEPQFQDAHSISIGDIAIAPSAPDTLYVGTGEANNQRSSYWGNGVYKSTDGGKSFTHIGLDGTDHIGRIVVHPTDPNRVYVAALGALYSANPERGLYRSTDGGDSWECVKFLNEDTGFVDVAIDPTEPQRLYAASYERRRRAWNFSEGGSGSRLWRSTDGGDTWTQMEGGLPEGDLGRIGIDLFLRNPETLYVCIENRNPRTEAPEPEPDTEEDGSPRIPSAEILADPLAAEEFFAPSEEAQDPRRRARARLIGGEVYRSDDGGDSWTKTNDRSIGGSPGYYYGQIRVDPNDADQIYVLSVPVYSSSDGGKTWTPAARRGRRGPGGNRSRAFHGNLHVDHHALWIDPSDSRHCLLGNDGGLGITWDRGKTWDHVARLPIAQFYAIGIDTRSPYRVYGGLQDNGSWGFSVQGDDSYGIEAKDAFRIGGGDGFYVVCDPTDPDVVYSESQFGGLSRQNLRTGERERIKPSAEKGSPKLRFNWMTPIVVSPHAPDTVYTGSQFLHRSRNRGSDWSVISEDLTTNDPDKKKGDVPHCTITTISESPLREGLLWVGTDDGRVWLTKNGGHRWTEMTDRFPAAAQGLWVSRVAASPHDENTAFVSFTGYREDRREPLLFRTDDCGDNFKAIHNDLPQEPINVVQSHPTNEHCLLVGTEMGAYVSVDDGATWFPLGDGLPHVPVHDVLVHPTEMHVLIGTHGRGIWALDGQGLAELDQETMAKSMHALPPSNGRIVKRGYSQGYTGARKWSVDSPFMTAMFRFHLREDSDEDVLVEVLDATGEVVFTREVEGKAGYHEVPWRNEPRRRGSGPLSFLSNLSGRGRFGNRNTQRPGSYAVRITHGEDSSVRAFEVIDSRGTQRGLGAVPGIGESNPETGSAQDLDEDDR